MPAALFDAHNHLADPGLRPHLAAVRQCLRETGVRTAVVNGTSPDDWESVLHLAASDTGVLPAIGLHPWQVNAAPPDWQRHFEAALQGGARAIGEIGLDQWIKDFDIERQQEAFRWQLNQAAQRNLPVSIHCLRAIGPLMDTLRSAPLPARGIHLHAFNGSIQILEELTEMGAYFSFNVGQLKPNAHAVPDRVRAVPLDRLLIETDAPDMLPPECWREFALPAPTTGPALNHPANLRRAYTAIAELRNLSFDSLTESVASNFHRYFLSPGE